MVLLTETEKKIVTFLAEKGETNVSQLAAGLGMDMGQLSRYVSSLEDDKGVLQTRIEGKEKKVSVSDGVEMSESGEIIVSAGPTFPLAEKFEEVLQRVIKGKLRRNIPLMVENFRMAVIYQQPGGLRALLTNWGIDPATQNVIVDSVFPGSGTYQGYAQSPYAQPYQPQVSYGPGGLPIVVLGGNNPYPGYPPSQGGPIIVTMPAERSRGDGGGGQSPIYIETKEKRKVTRPVTTEKGEIVKMAKGEKCPFCGTDVMCEQAEEPVVLQQGGAQSGTKEAVDLVKALKDLGVIPSALQPQGRSEREKELEEKLAKSEKDIQDRRFADLEKKIDEETGGLLALSKRQHEDLLKEMTHQRELDRVKGELDTERAGHLSADERMLDKMPGKAKEIIGGTLREIYKDAQGGYRPLPGGGSTTPAEAEAELKRRLGA